ncbi:MAG: LVIVD repeat-containing protein [Jejuia sp.]
MKPISSILGLALLFTIFSCDKNNMELVTIASPEIMSKSDFRKAVEIKSAQSIEESGKIYAYNDYIFVGDKNKGLHIIDNTNPKSPQPITFIKIPGNEDISVKNDFLYADSATDLIVFDISDINNIQLVERLEDVFDVYDYQIPLEADRVEWSNFNYETDIVTGWTLKNEYREKLDDRMVDVAFDASTASAENNIGVGGSLARFQIVDDFLYTVGQYSMSIFDIQNLSQPVLENTQYAGWNIETMFAAGDYLYLGSTNGMYIYDIKTPSTPEYVSEFTHWEGCDPVVVDGDYAYLTLRGGNLCGQLESVLEVIDIKDKANPVLAKRYTLENPYGLGIKSNMLFVCDGTAGLKIFDRKTPVNLEMVKAFENIDATDVIPLEKSLIMIGGNVLYQYEYLVNDINLISTYSLN